MCRFAGDARLLELPSAAQLCGDAGCRQEPLRGHVALLADAAAGLLSDTALQLLNSRSRRRLRRWLCGCGRLLHPARCPSLI